MNFTLHEELARNRNTLEKVNNHPITICGAGALGGNLCESLARIGCAGLQVIDRDRIEQHNLSTQPYFKSDVGSFKAKILANNLYRAVGIKVSPICEELTCKNTNKHLNSQRLVIDCFDNYESRQLLQGYSRMYDLHCLHVGLSGDFAEIIWDSNYTVPSDQGVDGCNYPLTRSIALLAATVAVEVIVKWISRAVQSNYTITLQDLQIKEMV